MKRLLCCALLWCVLLMFCACQETSDDNGASGLPTSDGQQSGVALTMIDTEYDENGVPRSITVEWHNLTDNEVYYYAAFDVFRYENGEKIDCAAEPIAFIEPVYILPSGDRQQQTYRLDGFDLTTPNDDGKLCFEFAADYTLQTDPPQTLTATMPFELSDQTLVYLTVDEIVKDGDDHYAQVTWHNDSDFDVTYGRPYKVERLEKGDWVDTAMADICFTMEAIILRPHSEKTERYAFLSNGMTLFDVSASGTYRIAADCTVDAQNRTLYAEFIL